MDQIQIGAIVVGLIALYPAWLMFQKAFLMSRKKKASTVVLCLILPLAVLAACAVAPFLVHADSEIKRLDFFIDFVLFAICPAALVGLAGFVWDQIEERPFRSILCAAGCLTVAILPTLYYLHVDDLASRFEVILISDNTTPPDDVGSPEVDESENTDSASANTASPQDNEPTSE